MKKKFKFLFLAVMIVTFVFSNVEIITFAESPKGNVEFLDTSKKQNVLESSYWNEDWRGENALLNKSYGWCSISGQVENEYLGYDFQKPTKVNFYEIEAAHDQNNIDNGYMVKSWEFQGYINENWEIIDIINNTKTWISTDEVRRFNVTCNKEYSKYRIVVKESFNTVSAEIGRLRFGIDVEVDWKKPILDVEPEKEKIRVNEEVTTDLTIDNITEIAAEDIRIKYDNEKLKFVGFEEADGIKLVKSIEPTENGELRVILASKGGDNIVNAKKTLLKLKFKGIKPGEAKVDITKGRVSDGIEMEKDLTDEQCDECKITIEAITDVNNSGEFTLLDLGIDARHLSKDPKAQELSKYNTDIVINNAIDEEDLLEIGKIMIENPNYKPNTY